jgi:hypothetical protein
VFDTIRRKQDKKDSKHKNIEIMLKEGSNENPNIKFCYGIFSIIIRFLLYQNIVSKMFLIDAHVIFFTKYFCSMNSIFSLNS